MIETYNANRELNIKDGKATVSFGFSVENLSPESARHVEKEIDAFIVRVTAPERPAPMNHDGGTKWSDDEKATVRPCTTADEAWKKYNAAFPDSPRSRKTVIRWWMDYGNKPEDKSTDGLPSTRSPDIPDQDKTGCEECDNIGGPSGTKDPDKCDACSPPVKKKPAIKPPRALKKPANHMGNGKWSTEEIKAVSGHKDRETAIEAYRVAFPNSPRNDNAIGMKWYALDRKAREEAKKEAKERKKSNAKVEKAAENVDGSQPAPSQSDSDKITMDKAPASELVTGLKVRQIKPWLGKKFHGIGTVVAREQDGAIICVRNGGHKTHKVGAHCLELVPAGEAAPKKAEAPPENDGVMNSDEIKAGDTVEYAGLPRAFPGTGKVTKAEGGHQEVVVQIGSGVMTVNRANLAKVGA